MRHSLTRHDATDITRLLMASYHEGVLDAYRIQDDAYCLQFVDECRRHGVVGSLDGGVCTASGYVLHLLFLCRKYHIERLGKEVIYGLPSSSPVLNLCMLMYLDGVSEYLNKPDANKIAGFEGVLSKSWATYENVDIKTYAIKRVTELCVGLDGRVPAMAYHLWLLTRQIGGK